VCAIRKDAFVKQESLSSEPDFEHRMKNYIAIILGYTDLLLQDTPPGDPRREDLIEIRKAAETALSLFPRERGPLP
jgi:hypothetical protein